MRFLWFRPSWKKHRLFRNGDAEHVRRYLRRKRNIVDTVDKMEETPLHYAVRECDAAVVKTLLEAGAEVNAQNILGETPLYLAVRSDRTPAVVKVLLDAGADPNVYGEKGSFLGDGTPLHLAVRDGSPAVVAALVRGGADPNMRDRLGATPLHWAVWEERDVEVVSTLLGAGADPNAREEEQRTPLHLAVRAPDSEETVSLLLRAGADPRAEDMKSRVPWHCAHHSLAKSAVGKRLKRAAPPELTSKDKEALIEELIRLGYRERPDAVAASEFTTNRKRVREIGRALFKGGGHQAMLDAHAEVGSTLGRIAARELEGVWGEVGNWL